MNIKEIKQKTEENINNVLKSMVAPSVDVQCSYNIEKDEVNALLIDTQKEGEVIQKIVVYSCIYGQEDNTLSVTGFARRYGYDNFGVALVTNEPVTVDEPFIGGIKQGIAAGLNMPTDAPAETAEAEVVETEPEVK